MNTCRLKIIVTILTHAMSMSQQLWVYQHGYRFLREYEAGCKKAYNNDNQINE